jgi:hypothetical protein
VLNLCLFGVIIEEDMGGLMGILPTFAVLEANLILVLTKY